MKNDELHGWAYRMPTPLTPRTQIYKVSCPHGDATKWYTIARMPNPQTYMDADGERVMSPHLPVQPTRELAQADLDAWVVKRRMVRCCSVCGCTDEDCHQCVAKLGHPCSWVRPGLCSACDSMLAGEG